MKNYYEELSGTIEQRLTKQEAQDLGLSNQSIEEIEEYQNEYNQNELSGQ